MLIQWLQSKSDKLYVVVFYLYLIMFLVILCAQEAMQQRETAQKMALQALREATVTETVVRHLKYTTESLFCCFHCMVLWVFEFENVIKFLGKIQDISQYQQISKS